MNVFIRFYKRITSGWCLNNWRCHVRTLGSVALSELINLEYIRLDLNDRSCAMLLSLAISL